MNEAGQDSDEPGAPRPTQPWRAGISRRVFLRRTALTGLSASSMGVLLAACGGGDEQSGEETAAEATSAEETAGGETSEAAAGGYDEMAYAGSTVRVQLVDGERDERGLQDKIAEIQERMGITVELSTLALGALQESNAQNLRAPESEFDIMHILGFSVASTVGADLLEPLTPFVEDPARTPEGFALDDFPKGQLDYVGYYDVENNEFGGDELYLIPGIHSGSVIMFYRPDLFEQAGIEVPTNWDDYLAAAEQLNSGGVAGNSMIGANDVSLFLVDWFSRFASMGGELMSGSPDDGDFTPNLTSEPAVRALQHMVDCRQFAPEAVTSYGFTESLDAFLAGNVAMMLFWSTIGGSTYDPEESRVADTVEVAGVPADSGVTPTTVRGGWGLGIPANLPQERKDAAWHLLTYLGSAEFEQHQVLNYATDPNRTSTFSEPELVEALPYLPVAGDAAENAQMLGTAIVPENFELIGEAAREFNLALIGDQDAETACQRAQDAWVAILQRAGHLT